jgi:hypothetical protein
MHSKSDAEVVVLNGSLQPLHDHFNLGAERPQALVIVSPT